jgi:hypothetical protein
MLSILKTAMMLSMLMAVLIVAASEAGTGWIGVVPTAVGTVTFRLGDPRSKDIISLRTWRKLRGPRQWVTHTETQGKHLVGFTPESIMLSMLMAALIVAASEVARAG